MVDDTVKLMNNALRNANHITLNIPQITLDSIKKNISMMYYNESAVIHYMHSYLLDECGLLSYFNEDIIRYIRPELLHSGIILNFTHTIIQAYNNKINEYLKKL